MTETASPPPKRRRRWFLWMGLGLLVLPLGCATVILLLPARPQRVLNVAVDQVLFGMYTRAQAGASTTLDRFLLRTMYEGMSLVGHVMYPEAAQILDHYLAGDSSGLSISAEYFRQSPVVRRAIAGVKSGTVGPITLRIHDDPRVAYAVNGFFIEVQEEGSHRAYHLYQRIEFDPLQHRRPVFTTFQLRRMTFHVPDGLIHAFDKEGSCKPFTVHARWVE